MEIAPADWLAIIRREYLDDFVRAGGAAVKVAVADDEPVRQVLREALRQHGEEAGYRVALVDAAETKVQLIDRVFQAVARQMPWETMARSFLARVIVEAGYQLPADRTDLTLGSLGAANDVPERRD